MTCLAHQRNSLYHKYKKMKMSISAFHGEINFDFDQWRRGKAKGQGGSRGAGLAGTVFCRCSQSVISFAKWSKC